MEEKKILELLSYYKKESICPYDSNSSDAMWWEGENLFYSMCLDDSFLQKIVEMLKEAIEDNSCSGILIDTSLSIEKRAVIFFLSLWHSKWFPYDDFDYINTYVIKQ